MFAVFSVTSIGIGVGVTTAMFSILYASFWPATGITEPRHVAMLANQLQGAPAWERAMSMADFRDYERNQHSFASVAAMTRVYQPVTIAASTELIQGEAVTGNYFALLGVDASRGRVLQPGDDRPAAPAVVVLSYLLWRSRFDSAPDVVGRTVRIGDALFEIVGVAAREYRGLNSQPSRIAGFWIPMASLAASGALQSPLERTDDHSRLTLSVAGRLAPGVSVEQANAEANGIGGTLDKSFVLTRAVMTSSGVQRVPGSRGWMIRSIQEVNGRFVGRVAIGAMAIVGLVLVVACTNLANLSLARGAGRQQELAVRLALGASRARLIRELVAESALIGACGFALAIAVSVPIMSLAATPSPIFNGMSAPIDPHVTWLAVAIAAGAVLLALLVCGLWPALKLSRADVRSVIASGGQAATPALRSERRLIAWQMVVSVAFFCVAAVFISALSAQARHDPGMDLEHLTVARTAFRLQRWDEARSRRAIDAIAAMSPARFGFEAVAATSSVPFGATTYVFAMVAADERAESNRNQALLLASTPGIFDALGVPIVDGRGFDQRDTAGSPPVAVISQTTARLLFGTSAAIGRTLRMRGSINALDDKTVETRTVIGITRDTDVGSMMSRRDQLIAFVPVAQRYEPTSFIVARSTGGAGAGSLRALIHAADPDVAIDTAGSGLVMLAGGWIAARIVAGVALAIGAVTLILTLAGLSGVLAQLVLRRTREIGIRKALGADTRAILRLVIMDGVRPVATGTGIGLGLGMLGGFLVRAAIPVSATPVQPIAILIVIVAVVPATLIACYLPARRATRVEPSLTLRT